MKRILVHCSQIGGASALSPLVEKLGLAHDLVYSGRDVVRACHGWETAEAWGNPDEGPLWRERAERRFEELAPDLVLTDTMDAGRGPEALVGPLLWDMAKARGIPCLAYVDCWWAYAGRFPDLGQGRALPDLIATVDSAARKAMLAEGFAPERVLALGSPWLSALRFAEPNKTSLASRRAFGAEPGDTLLVHVSSPVSTALGSVDEWGFSETTVAQDMLAALSHLPDTARARTRVMLAPHPEEDPVGLEAVVAAHAGRVRAHVARDIPVLDLVRAAHLVSGIYSIVLVEALALRKPVVSLQPGLKKEDICITNRLGATLAVYDQAGLEGDFLRAVTDSSFRAELVRRQEGYAIPQDTLARWEAAIAGLLAGGAEADHG